MFAEQIHVRLPEAVDRADVLPIARELVGVELMPGLEQGGDDVLAEVVLTLRVGLVGLEELFQHAPLEDVDAHGGVGRLRVLRLFFKFVDRAVFARVHDAEAAGLLERHIAHGDCAVGAFLVVEGEHRRVVHLVDMVAGEDQQDLYAAVRAVQAPRLAVADVLVQLQRLILGQDADGIDLGVDAVGKREIDDAVFAAERHGGLRRVLRQDHQTAALASGQQHCDTPFLLKVHSGFLLSR